MHVLKRSVLVLAAALAFLAGEARAQLVLPGKKPSPKENTSGGNVAPFYECLVCHARNYQVHDEGRRDELGRVIAWCASCKKDRSQVFSNAKGRNGRGGEIVVPAPVAPSASGKPAAPAHGAGASPPAAGPADFIYAELARQKRVDEALSSQAVESLLGLGEDGIAAARRNLAADHAAVLLTSARVLMRSGRPEDADLVSQRMLGRLPVSAGVPLLDLLVRADPVRASPKFLADLLSHPHVGVRIEAQKRLFEHLGSPAVAEDPADPFRVLEPVLAAKSADTRQRAVELLARVDDPRVTDMLLSRIADPSANVIAAVADALAGRADADIDMRLLGVAFRERWVLRTGACAVLALVEREDRELRPILGDSNVEPLLAGLQSGDPFISGACAVGLAGIGFRSRDTAVTPWLDQSVVDRLVATVSGKTFHSDLAALMPGALRRLELLTGQSFGSDGPRWVEWWIQSRERFFALRAWLEVRPEDLGRISVRYIEGGTRSREFTLLGPEHESSVDRVGILGHAAVEETVRLDPAQARDLVLALESEGLFGPEKMPGLRGSRGTSERTLQIQVGGRGKGFSFGSGASEPWFERAAALAIDLLDRNRWQRFPDPSRHLSPHDLWLEQSAWWSEPHTESERALRMKSLVLAALPSRPDAGRDEGVAELERAYERADCAEPADFQTLKALLGSEPYWSDRSRRLLDLCLRSARASGAVGEEGTPAQPGRGDREVPAENGRVLVDLMDERFPSAPAEELARIFSACGPAFAQTMASDRRVPIRIASARALLGQAEATPEKLTILMRLLGDPVSSVEVAAIEALGLHRVDSARTELIVRARLGVPEVRATALRAIGRIGGELVLDALSLAAEDPDPAIRLAAAEGLASLADPDSASLLIEMLGEGVGTPTVEKARAGLEALGPSAHDALLRVVASPTHAGRREAVLILARQGVPESASVLISMLSTSPRDAHLASELCVLTGTDLRAERDPPSAWWSWWDGVVHDDATAWFLAALARAGADPPKKADLEGAGTRAGRLAMLEVLGRREPHLVERARRELTRMLGRDLGQLPSRGASRDAWIAGLRDSITSLEPGAEPTPEPGSPESSNPK
ncbi:MAG: HEAT repeat domain-containing protein [Planctomycetota bacterium]